MCSFHHPYTKTSNIYYLTGKTNLFMQHFINHLILTCSASPDFLSLAEVVNYEQTAQGSDHRHDVTDTDDSWNQLFMSGIAGAEALSKKPHFLSRDLKSDHCVVLNRCHKSSFHGSGGSAPHLTGWGPGHGDWPRCERAVVRAGRGWGKNVLIVAGRS